MKIELRNIDSIKPYEQNPRINDAAVDSVAESLKTFGFRQPLVVDEHDTIIVGHTRWKAAKKLGLEKVPVHVAKDLTEAQVRAYRLADNQLHELSKWDYDLLPLELQELNNMDFDLGVLGFDEKELAKLLAPAVQEGLTDEDAVPQPPKVAVTKPGDLYLLGGKVKCPKCGKEHQL
jgi:ParB-like chromosome segregation protein Spo0J